MPRKRVKSAKASEVFSARLMAEVEKKMEKLGRTKYGLDPKTARRWSRWLRD